MCFVWPSMMNSRPGLTSNMRNWPVGCILARSWLPWTCTTSPVICSLVTWAAPIDLIGQGRPDAAVWVFEDLSALRQAEAALRENEARLRAVFETMAERNPSPTPAIFKNLGVAYQSLGTTRPDAPAAMVRAWRRYLAMAPADDPDVPKIRQAVEDTERTLATRTAR